MRMTRFTAVVATAALFAVTLAGCSMGQPGLDGTYLYELRAEEHDIDPESDYTLHDADFTLTINGDECELSITGPEIEDDTLPCVVDKEKSVLRIADGTESSDPQEDELPYDHDGDVITLHWGLDEETRVIEEQDRMPLTRVKS